MPLTVRLSAKAEARLAKLAKKTHRPKSYYVQRALDEFLDAQEDYLIAIARLERELPSVPIEEVERRLGLGG